MLIATPGQTASYSTLHNNSSNGGGSTSTSAAASTTKKSSTLHSTNGTTSGTAKSLNNNNHTASTVTTKNSLNSNTHSSTKFNYHANPKNDNIVCNKISNQNKATAASCREIISLTKQTATTQSLRSENSINSTITTTSKQQSFIQNLKDSVQKALISTTGNSSNKNSILNKHSTDKLKNNCNNSATSINNVTSSSSSTSYNANKVSTTTSSNTSTTSTAATQPSSSLAVVRSKHLSCSLSKLHTVAPTVIHRYPEERQHASSTDSLQKEMCHFKPIRIVPKTPWKSGSKSRGNCLRFPKANLATKKTEFVLKSNCDVNIRKKKQQQNRPQNDKINVDEIDHDDNEQENKEIHGIYKPKPSLTCLSTSITTPNHQSAFVCLVAQMKNMVNIQSKRQSIPTKTAGSIVEEASDESLKDLYQRKTQKPVKKQHKEEETPEQLPKVRNTRLSSNAVKNKRVTSRSTSQDATKEIVKRTNDKLNISKASTLAITKAKSRRKLGPKLNAIDMVALSATMAKEKLQNSVSTPAVASYEDKTVATASKSIRKRNVTEDLNDLYQQQLLTTSHSTPSYSVKSLSSRARRSSRLSTIKPNVTTNVLFKYPPNQNSETIKSSPKSHKNSTSVACFSPPLTRSRLKRLAEQGKIVANATADIKKRRT